MAYRPTIFDLRCLVWQFYPLSLSCVLALFYGGVLPPSAVLPSVALTIDPVCVTAFGGAPFGRIRYCLGH